MANKKPKNTMTTTTLF